MKNKANPANRTKTNIFKKMGTGFVNAEKAALAGFIIDPNKSKHDRIKAVGSSYTKSLANITAPYQLIAILRPYMTAKRAAEAAKLIRDFKGEKQSELLKQIIAKADARLLLNPAKFAMFIVSGLKTTLIQLADAPQSAAKEYYRKKIKAAMPAAKAAANAMRLHIIEQGDTPPSFINPHDFLDEKLQDKKNKYFAKQLKSYPVAAALKGLISLAFTPIEAVLAGPSWIGESAIDRSDAKKKARTMAKGNSNSEVFAEPNQMNNCESSQAQIQRKLSSAKKSDSFSDTSSSLSTTSSNNDNSALPLVVANVAEKAPKVQSEAKLKAVVPSIVKAEQYKETSMADLLDSQYEDEGEQVMTI